SQLEVCKTLQALQEDWMLVDDFPEKDFLVLVNMDREVMKDFYPKRILIQEMETQGLIKNCENEYGQQSKTYSYQVTRADGRIKRVVKQNPHVYYYKLTRKGKELLVRSKNA
ncbi:MAG TPA: hypothetical protein VFY66_00260, partial [Anaerolineales bacterium]|nr:hypothetical protein [Anaerolineales bacterium]